MRSADVSRALRCQARRQRALVSQSFFRTGKGQYGEGDVFIGVTVPDVRLIAKDFFDLSLSEIKKLLYSKIHEERLIALIILVEQFRNANVAEQKKIYQFYLRNVKQVNNWDLVDSSADRIVGAYLRGRGVATLRKTARSKNMWERRVAIVATFFTIKQGKFTDTLAVATLLLRDEHDLIHKATGWMLREVGKRSVSTLKRFLAQHYRNMPRTMLRYAIERFPPATRKRYLRGEI